MSYLELPPHPALRPYVDRFWMRTPDVMPNVVPAARVTADAAMPQAGPVTFAVDVAPARILPDGCIDVLIDVLQGSASVVGTMTRAVSYDGSSGTTIAAVRFKPGGARPFLRVPAADLTDRVLCADELDAGWLSAPAADAPPNAPNVCSIAAVLARLERSLLERLPTPMLHRDVRHATRRLFAARAPAVDELARELGHSRQHLARLFREHVGVGPKEFARVARLQRAIERVQRAPNVGLACLAVDLGYFDQAHMSRDFNDLAGLTPRAARQARGSIFPIPSLWLEA
jgi:AraC-like DNA-binding protein